MRMLWICDLLTEDIMSNPIKDEFDKISLSKDISEINNIIQVFQETGFLDRDNAIDKIKKLRNNDEDIAIVTTVKLLSYSIPFEQTSNTQIVSELIMQRDILLAKLAKKIAEEKK